LVGQVFVVDAVDRAARGLARSSTANDGAAARQFHVVVDTAVVVGEAVVVVSGAGALFTAEGHGGGDAD